MNLENEINKIANSWLQRKKEGLTEKEKDEFSLWIKNKTHAKAYAENKELISEFLNLDEDFISEMQNEVLQKENIFTRSKYIAASIAVACILIFSAYEIDSYYSTTYTQDYLSSNEKILNIVLPDKTIIDLDVKSQIKITYYLNKRTVILEQGKVIFNVSKNPDKPFYVRSGNTLIEVIGTKFEVVHLKNKSEINVIEGLVKVDYIYNKKGDKKTLSQLKRSQTLSINNEGKVLNYGNIDIKKIASWKNDIIVFDKMTLADASLIFERYSNQKMNFSTYELSQLKISGKFSTLHYDSFLEAISLIYPIKYTKNASLINISKK
ncbi:MAG: FecR domain-containing protein [Campylobacteraceae bacterium]|nr:FecR domain-containing protein [Campylobacteraceae bacterium]